MPTKKYREGSAGAAEQKADRIVLIVFTAIAIMCLIFQKVDLGFNDFYRAIAKTAPQGWKIIGFILTLGSVVPLYLGTRSPGETKGFKFAWGIMLALGWFCSAGWYAHQY